MRRGAGRESEAMEIIEIRLGKGAGEMRDTVEQMLEEMCQLSRTFFPRRGARWLPPTDVYETSEEFLVLVEMGGLRREEIEVTLDQNVLRIAGRRSNPLQEVQRRIHQMEIDFGPFERKIRISVPISLDEVQATYRDGFLLVRIPKAPPRDRSIQVQEA